MQYYLRRNILSNSLLENKLGLSCEIHKSCKQLLFYCVAFMEDLPPSYTDAVSGAAPLFDLPCSRHEDTRTPQVKFNAI